MNLFISILTIILMLILSAFFSGTEISFNTSNKIRLKKAAEANDKLSKVAYKISENFTTTLSAILIGNNLANIAASTAATVIFMKYISNDGVASVVSTAFMTLLVLTFGEIAPKIIAREHADTVVRWVAYPSKILTIILFPIVAIVMLFLKLLRKMWGRDNDESKPTITEEELSSIIDTIEEEGVIDEDKSDLLQSTLEFHETIIEEIMTPRIDLVTIDIEEDFDTIYDIIEKSHYSRIPVYEDNPDNIIGILYLNHFYREAVNYVDYNIGTKPQAFDIRHLLIKPCFLHKTMKLPSAMKILREKKIHIAIVVDEYGGTLGVVSMEDILEEIVGDIWDESDEIVTEISQTGEHTYEVNGDMNIDDFFEYIDFKPSNEFECEYSTVGGWAVEMLDSNPSEGESFNFENLYIVVSKMDDMRVTKITVLVNPSLKDEDD